MTKSALVGVISIYFIYLRAKGKALKSSGTYMLKYCWIYSPLLRHVVDIIEKLMIEPGKKDGPWLSSTGRQYWWLELVLVNYQKHEKARKSVALLSIQIDKRFISKRVQLLALKIKKEYFRSVNSLQQNLIACPLLWFSFIKTVPYSSYKKSTLAQLIHCNQTWFFVLYYSSFLWKQYHIQVFQPEF